MSDWFVSKSDHHRENMRVTFAVAWAPSPHWQLPQHTRPLNPFLHCQIPGVNPWTPVLDTDLSASQIASIWVSWVMLHPHQVASYTLNSAKTIHPEPWDLTF